MPKSVRSSQAIYQELVRWVYMTLYWNQNSEVVGKIDNWRETTDNLLKTMDKRNITLWRDVPTLHLNQSQIDALWNQTIKEETEYYSLLELEGSVPPATEATNNIEGAFWKTLKDDFDRTILTKWYSIDVKEAKKLLLSLLD